VFMSGTEPTTVSEEEPPPNQDDWYTAPQR